MKVVFLVRYPVEGFIWAKEQYGVRAALKAKELVNHYSWKENLEKARQRVASVCIALRAKGVEAAVDVYAGSLTRAVRSQALNGDVHLIMTRAGIAQRIASFLNGSSSLFDLFKRPAKSPVLLIHPGMAA
jgi:hypothetical protein